MKHVMKILMYCNYHGRHRIILQNFRPPASSGSERNIDNKFRVYKHKKVEYKC